MTTPVRHGAATTLLVLAACSGSGGGAAGCELAALRPASLGCEFWAVDLDLVDYLADPASAPWGLALTNPGSEAATVTIERNDAAPGAPPQLATVDERTVAPGATELVTLAAREVDCGSAPNQASAPGTCLSSRALRVTSTQPVAAQQLNPVAYASTNDGSLLLPTSALGARYRVLGWGAGHPIPVSQLGGFVSRAYVTVVGTRPGTQVTVRPSWRLRGNPPVDALAAGGSQAFTIGPFDVLNLETADATFADDPALVADLSGTAISASAPVAVFSGAELAVAPSFLDVPTYQGWSGGACCADHLEEQLLPLEAMGARYVVPRSPARSTGGWAEPDVLRFVGAAEPATIATSLPAPFDAFTLQPGEVRTTWTQGPVVVDASAPILVGQVLVSAGYVEGRSLGDPSLVVLPPVEQLQDEYVLAVPPTWAETWVAAGAQAGTELTLDGAAPAGCVTSPAGRLRGVDWEQRTCPLQPGAHRLQGSLPFVAVLYGYGAAGSYAMPAGTGAAGRYQPPPLE